MARCDNQCAVIAVNKGLSKDLMVQSCIRELFYVCSLYSFEIKAVYIRSEENVLPDALSRFKEKGQQKRFYQQTAGLGFSEIAVSTRLLHFSHPW